MFDKSVFDDLNHKEHVALLKLKCVLESALIESKCGKGMVSKQTEIRLRKAGTNYRKAQKKVIDYLHL